MTDDKRGGLSEPEDKWEQEPEEPWCSCEDRICTKESGGRCLRCGLRVNPKKH